MSTPFAVFTFLFLVWTCFSAYLKNPRFKELADASTKAIALAVLISVGYIYLTDRPVVQYEFVHLAADPVPGSPHALVRHRFWLILNSADHTPLSSRRFELMALERNLCPRCRRLGRCLRCGLLGLRRLLGQGLLLQQLPVQGRLLLLLIAGLRLGARAGCQQHQAHQSCGRAEAKPAGVKHPQSISRPARKHRHYRRRTTSSHSRAATSRDAPSPTFGSRSPSSASTTPTATRSARRSPARGSASRFRFLASRST